MASDVTAPPPHSKRVEAWVYAIMNPLIESLRREILLLDKGNLSWRFHSKKCEYIRPISEYIESSQWPNYEDFVVDNLNLGFKESFEEHDRQVSEVESTATRFFDGLVRSDMFLEQVKDSLKEYEKSAGANPQSPNLDLMKENLPKVVAEYLVNRTDLLPDHYLTHEYWKNYKSKFDLSAGELEPYHQRPTFQALTQAAVALMDVSQKLLLRLENQRESLCRTYDIPFAPIPVDKSHSTNAFIAWKI